MHARKVASVLMVSLCILLLQGCGGGGGGSAPPPTITDINGGVSGSGTVGSVFIVDGTNFGTLTSANAGYSVDFRDAATNAVAASATVNYAAGNWNDIYIKGTVPSGLAPSATYKVTVTTPGGTSNAVNFLVVPSVSFSPSTILWSATASLPQAQQGFPAVVAPVFQSISTATGTSASITGTYIYALGGNTADTTTVNGKAANVASVSFNKMDDTTGALANSSWTATTPLPDNRGFAAAVAGTGFNSLIKGNKTFLYLLGGLDGTGAATSTVYYAPVNADGSVGSWAATTALPKALFAEGAAIFNGHIYVAGGNDTTGAPVASVYSAKINSDGTVGSWQSLPNLPDVRAYHQLLVAAGVIYVVGGDNTTVDPVTNVQTGSSQGTIFYNGINLQDGSLANATWSTNGNSLGKNREKFSAVVAGGYVLVSGGLYNGASNGSSEQSYAQINPDGSISSFNGATGTHTISGTTGGYDFYNQAGAYFVDTSGNPHVLVIGGGDINSGLPQAGVWYQH